jgi:methylenetetrahydrofolate reductase (NADPH)
MAGKPGGQGPDQGAGGILQRTLAVGELAVTAEIGPPRGASIAPVTRKATALRDWVHAVNITDNASATARLSSWAGSLAVLGVGVEPIMQLTCRDRNRIALQSELLGASALGVPNMLLMTGDHPRHGDHPDATAVFDLDGAQLLRVARTMRDEGQLMSGRELLPPPSWLLGAVTDPSGPVDAAVARLAVKVEAGAQFVQTQYVFDVPAFAQWLDRAADLGLLEQCQILAGAGPVLSERALHHLAGVPGINIPPAVADRLLATGSPEQFRAAGEQLCAEIIAELVVLPGVAGLHIMAPGGEDTIPGILAQAGLRPWREAGLPQAGRAQAGRAQAGREEAGNEETGNEETGNEAAGNEAAEGGGAARAD